ncbi:MAG TPA: SEC-C metal-binding domain-containing protein [Rhabdochlamydiaceae bacterium]|nr:SEC-C metal-binding domain-containing protein [Rhabdochlamydiaceae bacterium]
MTSKVGRNDPCPCGSGKKFKKCCEERMVRKKFSATILSAGRPEQTTQAASKISTNFFQRVSVPAPKEPEHQPPHDHPEPSTPI